MTQEQQIQALLQQNAEMLEQNRQLIAMMQGSAAQIPQQGAPALPVRNKEKKLSKKQRAALSIMHWYGGLKSKLCPEMAALLKANIKAKGLWLQD